MYLKKLELYNFRQFESIDNNPGLVINFHNGLNVLVGENDSGKSSIIDSIKIALRAHGNEFFRINEDDFSFKSDGTQATELKILCTITDLNEEDRQRFIEFSELNEKDEFELKIEFSATRNENIYTKRKIGGQQIPDELKENLKVVYLKPLRNAERDLIAGKNSRLAQILSSHATFNQGNNDLIESAKVYQKKVKDFFLHGEGKGIHEKISNTLKEMHDEENTTEVCFNQKNLDVRNILESLSLNTNDKLPGLGELNLICMASELLLQQEAQKGRINLSLIEEIEAHLHPQAQLRLINFIQHSSLIHGIQTIITTHSNTLCSKVNLKNLILISGGHAFPLKESKLTTPNFMHLQRFLDATKANLFFAKGVILVEGTAEELLIPTIANIIGLPLDKHGVSVVNIGGTGMFHYANIFERDTKPKMNVRVSIVTDCDCDIADSKKTIEERIRLLETTYDGDCTKTFVSPTKTFETCIINSFLKDDIHLSAFIAKKLKNGTDLNKKNLNDAINKKNKETLEFKSKKFSDQTITEQIYEQVSNNKGRVAQVLMCLLLGKILRNDNENADDNTIRFDVYYESSAIDEEKRNSLKKQFETSENLRYIIDAIKHACGKTIKERNNNEIN